MVALDSPFLLSLDVCAGLEGTLSFPAPLGINRDIYRTKSFRSTSPGTDSASTDGVDVDDVESVDSCRLCFERLSELLERLCLVFDLFIIL